MTRSILIIEDEDGIRSLLSRIFERDGWLVDSAPDGERGIARFDAERPDLVLLDLNMPGLGGLSTLERLRILDPDATVLILTGTGGVAEAVEAMQLGAENFLKKPIDPPHLAAAIERAWEKVELKKRDRYFSQAPREQASGLELLGTSPQMQRLALEVRRLAETDTTVLLLGETGTGKGWTARLIHTLSSRARMPLVDVNCAGLSATFLDSELFGHEKGAFTDAKSQKHGLFEVADRGTLFLDEIGDLALDLQPKLLRVIETKRFRRLGGTREISADVRLVAATNRELDRAVDEGKFREDLFYRLAVMPIRLPPLRERDPAELHELAIRMAAEIGQTICRAPVRLSADALLLLQRYAWPGNLRELRNVLERACILAGESRLLGPEHLPLELRRGTERNGHAAAGAGPNGSGSAENLDLSLEELERRHIARVLARCGQNRKRAAAVLRISRTTLYAKLDRYQLG